LRTRVFLAAAGLALLQAAPLLAQTTEQDSSAAKAATFFEQRVKPVLATCAGCHTTTASGGLRVDSRDALIKGGVSGPAIVVGDPDKSLLMAAVKHAGAVKMPLGGDKLSDEQIANLATWIKDGAAWPAPKTGNKPEAVLADHFENHIRPVLAQQCFACHTATKSAGLRLDSIKDMLAGGTSGPAVVPGDPDKSLLMTALRHNGPVKMPKGGTRLTDEQLEHFTTWIKDGAYWPTEKSTAKEYTAEQKNLWSIQPLKKPAVPAVKDTAWPINDIDRFVLAKLEKEGLKPVASADRRTLLRRVTYDLTGLMPSHAEVKAFEQDTDANAWEKVIDRLLASPRYGERWARHWMDVVRYGEDDYRVGKQPDRAEKYPFAYLYRDWLIRALNDDMSYDMFVKAQLAADQLDPAIRDRHIPALGMNGNGIWIFHASPAPVERADEWHDKVDVTTKAFLGLTVGCARCHDHKYDAIYTKDYYQLTSVFASSRFKAYPRVPKSVVDEYEKQNKVLQKKNRALRQFLENASDLYAQMLFVQSEEYMVAAWKVETQKKATVESVADESKVDPELLGRWVRFLKKKPDNYRALVTWQQFVASGKGKEPEALKKLEDQAKKLAKEFVTKVSDINEKYLKLTKENEFTLAQVKGTPVQDDEDDEEQDPDKAKEPFDPLPNRLKRRLNAYQIDLKSLDREDLVLWRDVFEADVPEVDAPEPEEGARRKPGLLKLTDGALERRLTADLKTHVERARADIDAFRKSMPPQYPMVYGIEEGKQPSDLKVFVRGNPYAFGEDAPRAFPSLLSQGTSKLFTQGSGRMELADEIIRQPITARVIANRIWRWHTGRGIVDTPSNFGMVGEKPTNPELLEYLATTFLEGGMSWKTLHKQILLSRTYQLSSTPVATNAAKDADNRFFWRANRIRLEAEGVWDGLLQAGGALDVKGIGGPSEDLTEKTERRGVYAKVSRMYPSDFQATFDVPTATISAERRYTTNVPQQRLFFLNNSFVHKQAERLVERIKDAGDPTAQVKKAFELVYQREATQEEIAAALELVTMEPIKPSTPAGEARAGESRPEAGGDTAKDDKSASKKLSDSPLRSFAWALLSSNEFLFID
jgi:mono/diheme cytochrome c family protein